MNKRSTVAVALIAGLAWLYPMAVASAQAPATDAGFVEHAAHDNAAEIQVGTLARQKASDPAVREYADRLVRDHQTANSELQALAARKGWVVPTQPGPQDIAMRDRLSALSGREFDRRFADEMLQDHNKAVSEFERAAQSTADPELRDWVQKTLPVLREHQRMAQDLSRRLTATPAASPATAVAETPWCAGAWAPGRGTNFGVCAK